MCWELTRLPSPQDCTIALLSLSNQRMEVVRQIEDQHTDVGM